MVPWIVHAPPAGARWGVRHGEHSETFSPRPLATVCVVRGLGASGPKARCGPVGSSRGGATSSRQISGRPVSSVAQIANVPHQTSPTSRGPGWHAAVSFRGYMNVPQARCGISGAPTSACQFTPCTRRSMLVLALPPYRALPDEIPDENSHDRLDDSKALARSNESADDRS
jgi:hypothetical protein